MKLRRGRLGQYVCASDNLLQFSRRAPNQPWELIVHRTQSSYHPTLDAAKEAARPYWLLRFLAGFRQRDGVGDVDLASAMQGEEWQFLVFLDLLQDRYGCQLTASWRKRLIRQAHIHGIIRPPSDRPIVRLASTGRGVETPRLILGR